jgi:hypothetical protein
MQARELLRVPLARWFKGAMREQETIPQEAGGRSEQWLSLCALIPAQFLRQRRPCVAASLARPSDWLPRPLPCAGCSTWVVDSQHSNSSCAGKRLECELDV